MLNNPLIATAPTGYFFWFFVALAFAGTAAAFGDTQMARAILAVAIGLLLGPGGYAGAWLGGGLAQAVAAGFAVGGVSTGTLKGAFTGALSAGIFYGAGSFADGLASAEGGRAGAEALAANGNVDPLAASGKAISESIWAHGGLGRAGLHALAGCVGAVAGGGKCQGGALSAGFAEFAGPRLDGLGAPPLISRAIVGGASSVLGGGKFANGAMTASFG